MDPVEHRADKHDNGEVDVQKTVRLVLGVARLGEADLAGWWNSHGLDRPGSYVLSRSFRRTWRPAALQIDLISAGKRHEDALGGRATALHLFSHDLQCRRWANAWLAEQKTASKPDPLFDELARWRPDSARQALAEWTEGTQDGEIRGEGLFLGTVTRDALQAHSFQIVRSLASAYLSIQGPFRAPYLDLV